MARRIPMRRRTGVTDTTYPAVGVRAISPTDIAQYIRMEQCERYLRLRLHERARGVGDARVVGRALDLAR